MIYKSYILEKNLEPIFKHKMFLFYGENFGLLNEFKEKVKKITLKIETINLNQEMIIKDRNLITKEILNKSLFHEKKVLFISQVNDKILDIIEEISDKISDERIYIFADKLEKKSKLRSYFEKSKVYGSTVCYSDNEITIKNLISSKLKDFSGVSPNVISHIFQSTGLDRNNVNNEIKKIESCFNDKRISAKELGELLNLPMNEDLNELKDQALKGNKIITNKLLSETNLLDEHTIYFLNLVNQRINRLKEVISLSKNKNFEKNISEIKPPIFWKDKPIIVEQCKKWSLKKLQKAQNKTFETEKKIKSNATIKKSLLVQNLVIDLCQSANSS